ncbi:hypothetical protein NMG60_11031674 [Bertholletia excelsa]
MQTADCWSLATPTNSPRIKLSIAGLWHTNLTQVAIRQKVKSLNRAAIVTKPSCPSMVFARSIISKVPNLQLWSLSQIGKTKGSRGFAINHLYLVLLSENRYAINHL